MKKLFITALFLSGFAAYAQKSFEFGLRGMPQISVLLNDNDFAEGSEIDYEMSFTGSGGVMAGFNFSNHIGIRAMGLYSVQLQRYHGDFQKFENIDTASYSYIADQQKDMIGDTAANYDAEVALKYFKVPLLFKVYLNQTTGSSFVFEIGPQLNILNSAEHYLNGNKVVYSQVPGFKTTNLYNDYVIGAVMSFGIDWSLTESLKLNTQFRFDYDLTDVENKEMLFGGKPFWDPKREITRTTTGAFMVGLTYVIGHKDDSVQ